MSDESAKKYWQTPEERDGDAASMETRKDEFPAGFFEGMGSMRLDRAGFLKLAGLSLSGAMLAGCENKARKAIPYLVQPEEVVPGNSVFYASSCGACSAGCGVLSRNRDGRPVKLEGNPDHPVSRGALCALGQASVMDLYSPLRLKGPRLDQKPATWTVLDAAMESALATVKREGKEVRFLTGTLLSPTLRRRIGSFLEGFPGSKLLSYDALSCSAILKAHETSHGRRLLPHFRFDRAEVVAAFDADFLGTWISPVEFARDYASARKPAGKDTRFSRHVQFEAGLSLTGARADQRYVVRPSQLKLALAHLARHLSRPDVPSWLLGLPPCPIPDSDMQTLASQLAGARGKSLVVCGLNDLQAQSLAIFINQRLGNYGHTLDLEKPSLQKQGDESGLEEMLVDMKKGRVGALIVLGADPVYELPFGAAFGEAMKNVPLTLSFAGQEDETSALCRFSCPDHHWLESWGDSEPVQGTLGLLQPVLKPLYDTRPALESLSQWSGEKGQAYEIVRARWRREVHPASGSPLSFEKFWDLALDKGVVLLGARGTRPRSNEAQVPGLKFSAASDLELTVHARVGILDGKHANNPWLQEMPDPVTKVTWDNYASISAGLAGRVGLHPGDLVKLQSGNGASVELPVLIQPGQQEETVSIALGYGRLGSGSFSGQGPEWILSKPAVEPGGRLGANAAPFLKMREGLLVYESLDLSVSKAPGRHWLASTQGQHSLFVPGQAVPPAAAGGSLIREMSLPAYLATMDLPGHKPEAGMIPEMPYPGHRWGMAIDLSSCNGCSACVVACQVENNVPVVGQDEVRRGREMQWLRIDRYYSEKEGKLEVVHQPMLCQHCGKAPCEPVCPTAASVHSSEGLNQQVYNRCIGTRYCENNCPYKVRRFNWFDHAHKTSMQDLGLNPDVVVRSRGVMEKCTFCVHRIEEGKSEAKRRGQGLKDGDVVTACQQACASQAIVFGDLNDPASRVSQWARDKRAYKVLEELNVSPSISYLSLIRNT